MITDPFEGKALTPPADAATYLGGVSVTTVKRLAAAGHLTVVHVGDRPMVTVESLRAFITTHQYVHQAGSRHPQSDGDAA